MEAQLLSQPLNLFPDGNQPICLEDLSAGRVDGFPRVTRTTLTRWRNEGIKAIVDEEVTYIKLKAVHIGAHWFTCAAWLNEFVAAQNAPGTVSSRGARRKVRSCQLDRSSKSIEDL